MNKQIAFEITPHFKGRNGIAKCSGIDLQNATTIGSKDELVEVIVMSPITSRGVVASSWIDVPIDSITDLIRALQEFNPKHLYIDDTEQRFVDWLDNSECPQCGAKAKGNIQAMSHTVGKCMECGVVIDLENWKVLR
jgi:hypothetical protein